jgi:transposase
MSNKRYTDEFKTEAIKQVTERGYSVRDVSERLGVTTHSLYAWFKKARGEVVSPKGSSLEEIHMENIRLKSELIRVKEERDILKKAATYFARASG